VNDEVFSIFSTLVRNKAGIVLPRDKAYLLESRLLPVARKHRKESLDALSRDIGRGAVAI
jgi:chemotaxis protein methyltransferase CheR